MHTLDTNAIIYYLSGDATAIQALEDIFNQETPLYLSTNTVLELFSLRELSDQDKDDIERLLASYLSSLGIHLRRDSKGTTIVTENRLKPGPLEI